LKTPSPWRKKAQIGLGRSLQTLLRSWQDESSRLLAERGWAGLSLAHTVLLENLDEEGSRCTTVTERAGLRKQSMGTIAEILEAQGCIVMSDDPEDGRARIMRFTERGHLFLADARAVAAEIEGRYEALVGVLDYAAFRRAIAKLVVTTMEAPK